MFVCEAYTFSELAGTLQLAIEELEAISGTNKDQMGKAQGGQRPDFTAGFTDNSRGGGPVFISLQIRFVRCGRYWRVSRLFCRSADGRLPRRPLPRPSGRAGAAAAGGDGYPALPRRALLARAPLPSRTGNPTNTICIHSFTNLICRLAAAGGNDSLLEPSQVRGSVVRHLLHYPVYCLLSTVRRRGLVP